MMIIVFLIIIGIVGLVKTFKNKKIKLLILGANGMLGSMVYFYFSHIKSFRVTGTYNKKKIKKEFINFNVEKFILNNSKYSNFFKSYDYIINCIGLIKPDTINNTLNTIKINSIFPFQLESCVKKSTKIFQINTDCVFSGINKKQNQYYFEDSLHDPLDVYGKTKSLGEINSNKIINIRTSIIGPEPYYSKSLMEWFFKEKKPISGFIDHNWNGVTTLTFAKIIEVMIRNKFFQINNFNISFVNKISKYELLIKMNKIFLNSKQSIIRTKTGNPINRVLNSNYKKLNDSISMFLYQKKNISIDEMLIELSSIISNYYKFYKK